MSIATTTTSVVYTGNGSTVNFAVPFKFMSAADLVVTVTDLSGNNFVQTLGSTYSVTGADAPPSGNVAMNSAVTTGYTLTIARVTPFTQPTSLPSQGPFVPSALEDMADRNCMMIQEVSTQGVNFTARFVTDEALIAANAAAIVANATALTATTAEFSADEALIAANTAAIAANAASIVSIISALNSISGGAFSAQATLITQLTEAIALNAALTFNLSHAPFTVTGGCGGGTGCELVIVGTAAGGGGTAEISTAYSLGDAFISQTPNMTTGCNAVAFNGTMFVAVGPAHQISTSPATGATWTSRTNSLANHALNDVTWNAALSLWVTVGDSGLVGHSADGITWAGTTAGSGNFSNVLSGGSFLLAIPASGTAAYYSTNGTTWTTTPLPGSVNASNPRACLTYSVALGLFFFIDSSGGIWTAAPGMGWTLRTTVAAGCTVVAAGALVVALNPYAAGTEAATSFDGITWTARAPAFFGLGNTLTTSTPTLGTAVLPNGAIVLWDGSNALLASAPNFTP